ncbi:hypothetical protein TNCV_4434081 [Trichonephila clavipes]|nr:hypothetical protein TNCV_4434081 [Trichonephila clavipes]
MISALTTDPNTPVTTHGGPPFHARREVNINGVENPLSPVRRKFKATPFAVLWQPVDIERGDSEKVIWASQIWCSVTGRQCEITLGDDRTKPFCNSWSEVSTPSAKQFRYHTK